MDKTTKNNFHLRHSSEPLRSKGEGWNPERQRTKLVAKEHTLNRDTQKSSPTNKEQPKRH